MGRVFSNPCHTCRRRPFCLPTSTRRSCRRETTPQSPKFQKIFMATHPILVAGRWRESRSSGTFQATNPATGEPIPGEYPVSSWADCDEALTAAVGAAEILRTIPTPQIARFLTRFAERIEARATELVDMANRDIGLPKAPRLS
jgi:2,5-dioxopentanoate dehydrogenase